jgi:hypothetical protein
MTELRHEGRSRDIQCSSAWLPKLTVKADTLARRLRAKGRNRYRDSPLRGVPC